MRKAWPDEKPMSVRISATDWQDGGITGDDAVAVARAFAEAGCDLIDVSTGQTVPDAEPVYGRMFQTPFSDQIRNEAGLATMCVGAITTADQVNTIVAAGRADPRGARAPAPGRSVLHHEGGRLVRRNRHPLPAAISSGPRPDLPQFGARQSGPDRTEAQGEAEGPRTAGWKQAAE